MSKDIRSFFKPQKVKKTKAEDDTDVIPESPDVEIKIKKRENRKKRVLSDSDEEIFSTKKKKTNGDGHKSSLNPKNKVPAKTELKEVKAVDIFGSGPIKRTKPNVKTVQRKTETGIHLDDDFDKSLLELDSTEEFAFKKEASPIKSCDDKSKINTNSAKTNIEIKKSKSLQDKSCNGNGSLSSENHESESVSSKAKKKHLDLTTENASESRESKISKQNQQVNKSEISSCANVNTTSSNNKRKVFEATDLELDASQANSKKRHDKSLNESDADFIKHWDFWWKVTSITLVSCLPLYIVKFMHRKWSARQYRNIRK